MHPKERRDRAGTGTGRLAHMCMPESKLFVGFDFENDERVTSILNDEKFCSFILYPGSDSVDLSGANGQLRFKAASKQKIPVIFVLDASWSCAKTLIANNPRLASLPKVSFESKRISTYGFKKQPSPECLSSIEAVHEIVTLLLEQKNAEVKPLHGQEILMEVFQRLCAFQSGFSPVNT